MEGGLGKFIRGPQLVPDVLRGKEGGSKLNSAGDGGEGGEVCVVGLFLG